MGILDGKDKMLANMKAITPKVIEAVTDAVDITAIKIANHAKANHTPGQAHALGRFENVTTNLTNSIIPQITKADAESVEAVIGAGVGASAVQEYAPYVEFGTYGRPGFPFMRPAKESEKEAFPKRVQKAISGNI
jgi:HK97 gp10 family phage protein